MYLVAGRTVRTATERSGARLQKISGVEPLEVADREALAKAGITKIIWYDTHDRIQEWMGRLSPDAFESINYCTSNPAFLEFFNGKVSKRVAIQKLGELLGISAAETVAIGDGLNDIPMLEYAGLSVAMGNASEKVKAIAHQVVADNDADGVAQAIEAFILPNC